MSKLICAIIICLLVLYIFYHCSQCKGVVAGPTVVPAAVTESFNVRMAPLVQFSNTLQRRMGMSSAGEHFTTNPLTGTFLANEHFSTRDPAAGTMWEGYHKASVLSL